MGQCIPNQEHQSRIYWTIWELSQESRIQRSLFHLMFIKMMRHLERWEALMECCNLKWTKIRFWVQRICWGNFSRKRLQISKMHLRIPNALPWSRLSSNREKEKYWQKWRRNVSRKITAKHRNNQNRLSPKMTHKQYTTDEIKSWNQSHFLTEKG